MSDITAISATSATAVLTLPERAATQVAPQGPLSDDRLEISETGRMLSRLCIAPAIREDKVAEIRQAIEEGSYTTLEKLDHVVDRLMDVLDLR